MRDSQCATNTEAKNKRKIEKSLLLFNQKMANLQSAIQEREGILANVRDEIAHVAEHLRTLRTQEAAINEDLVSLRQQVRRGEKCVFVCS